MVAQIDFMYFKQRPKKILSRLVSYIFFEGRPVTTKGRFINFFLLLSFAIFKRVPQFSKITKPLFIIGIGRSGTTKLGMLMSMHKNVGFLNEPKILWHSIIPIEDVIGSYTRDGAKYRLSETDTNPEMIKIAHRLFGSYLWAVRSSRLVDKYPELVFRVPFVKEIFPDAKFIFLVRNGWDTCSSIVSWTNHNCECKGVEKHDWWGIDNRKWNLMLDELVITDDIFSNIICEVRNFSKHCDMAAVEWIITMREGVRQLARNPDCIKLIHYEDLLNKPREVLSDLLSFTELDDDPVFMNYAENVLRKSTTHAPFVMNELIRPLFEETMKNLGYPI